MKIEIISADFVGNTLGKDDEFVDLSDVEDEVPVLRSLEPYRRNRYMTYPKANGNAGFIEYEMEG